VISAANVGSLSNNHLHVPIIFEEVSKDGQVKAVTTSTLLDSGATTTFINKQLVTDTGFMTYPFHNPIPLLNINGMNN
jgi:hypothetical protein